MICRITTLLLFFWATTTQALRNPILPGFNPDPSILRVGSDYFIVTSTFEYFPGHPIYHSKNLVDWTLIGHGLNRPSQLALFGTAPDGGVWAPSLRFHDGTYFLASTTRYSYTGELRTFPRSFYVTTKDIFSNNWSDPIYLDTLGYDADLFWDVNDDVYATWSGNNNNIEKIYGIWQNKIDIKTGNSLTHATLIFNGTLPLNSTSRPEGPHIYYINSTYYLMIAEGGTGLNHRSTIQRSDSPSGPWESNPANPILFNGEDLSLPVQGTGHADFIEAEDGKWWGVALGYRPQAGDTRRAPLGRETFLFPVTWEAGWPIFNNGQPLLEHTPDVLFDKTVNNTYLNNFTADKLDDSFYFIRTPYKAFHSLAANPGHLRIYGNAYTLGDRDSPAALLRKQTSYEETFETQLTFSPSSNLTQAGITIFYSDWLHNDIGVTGNEDARFLFIRTIVPATQVGPWALTATNNTAITTNYYPLSSTTAPVTLVIQANRTSYSFGYSETNGTAPTFLTTIDSLALAVQPATAFFFQGTAWGVFNTGTGRESLSPADFVYWKQQAFDPYTEPLTNSTTSV